MLFFIFHPFCWYPSFSLNKNILFVCWKLDYYVNIKRSGIMTVTVTFPPGILTVAAVSLCSSYSFHRIHPSAHGFVSCKGSLGKKWYKLHFLYPALVPNDWDLWIFTRLNSHAVADCKIFGCHYCLTDALKRESYCEILLCLQLVLQLLQLAISLLHFSEMAPKICQSQPKAKLNIRAKAAKKKKTRQTSKLQHWVLLQIGLILKWMWLWPV